MSDEAKTIPIVVRIPDRLGLTGEQISTLEAKWQADLTKAATESGTKIKWHIDIHIEIGSDSVQAQSV